jgi:hypothetical protein
LCIEERVGGKGEGVHIIHFLSSVLCIIPRFHSQLDTIKIGEQDESTKVSCESLPEKF